MSFVVLEVGRVWKGSELLWEDCVGLQWVFGRGVSWTGLYWIPLALVLLGGCIAKEARFGLDVGNFFILLVITSLA